MKKKVYVLLLVLSILINNNCSRKVDIPTRSFYGIYKPTVKVESIGKFSAGLYFKGIENTKFDIDTLPSELPLVNVLFENSTDSVVVLEFPFNWDERFINKEKTVCLWFDNSVSEELWSELFYPSKSDTLNGFIYHPRFVFLNPKESLSFDAFVFNPIFYKGYNEITQVSLYFKYTTLKKIKKMRTRNVQDLKLYKMKPITVLLHR